jgi:DNA-binding HxlR family transcriptional regulator
LTSSSSFEFTDEEIREGLIEVLEKNPDKKWEEKELFDAVDDHLVRKTVDDSLERLLEIGYIKKTVNKETGEETYSLTKKGNNKYFKEKNKK